MKTACGQTRLELELLDIPLFPSAEPTKPGSTTPEWVFNTPFFQGLVPSCYRGMPVDVEHNCCISGRNATIGIWQSCISPTYNSIILNDTANLWTPEGQYIDRVTVIGAKLHLNQEYRYAEIYTPYGCIMVDHRGKRFYPSDDISGPMELPENIGVRLRQELHNLQMVLALDDKDGQKLILLRQIASFAGISLREVSD